MVLGPQGVGKTALVSEALRQAAAIPGWKETAAVVQLSGLVQTDDKVTLRDISKQLDLENVVGDKVFGSFADNLSFLIASLKTGDSATSKPIIFVLDEFESGLAMRMRNMRIMRMRMRIENLIHIFHIKWKKTSLFKRQ